MLLLLLALCTPPPPPTLGSLLQKAQQLVAASDRSGAQRELEEALRLYPRSAVVRNFLGILAAEDGDRVAAEKRFREATAADPRYTDAYLNLGRLHQENAAHDPQAASKALQAYAAVLGYEPTRAEARYQSAVLQQASGRYERALQHLDHLSAGDQERPGALAVRCAALAGLGRRAEADVAGTRLLARAELAEADVRLALPALLAHGREDLAERLLDALRERGLLGADLLGQLGRLQEKGGRLAEARRTLEQGAAAQPASVEMLLDLARVAHKERDYRGALGYLAHARDLAPGDARIHFFFGLVCVDLELGAEAYTSLQEAVRLDPENASINYAMGGVALHRRDPSEAIPYFKKYTERRPDDPRGGLALGIATYQAKDFASARTSLRAAADQPQTRAAASYYLARLAREENDLEEALRRAREAVEANPAYADAWAELGLVQFRRRETGPAEAALRKCLELEPQSYLGNLHLLMLYERTKDGREAEQARVFEEIKKVRDEQAEDFRRVIEIRPY